MRQSRGFVIQIILESVARTRVSLYTVAAARP
jgi:hypothetical protein